jgi:hypothetical protein
MMGWSLMPLQPVNERSEDPNEQWQKASPKQVFEWYCHFQKMTYVTTIILRNLLNCNQGGYRFLAALILSWLVAQQGN